MSVGRRRVEASAIVPGPALVTMQSAAAMYSSMFVTKPRMRASTEAGHACASSSRFASAFLPHTTTSVVLAVRRVARDGAAAASTSSSSSSWAPSSVAISLARREMRPTPSPPPTTRAVVWSAGRSRAARRSALGRGSGCQKASRSGRPCWRILCSGTPTRRATLRTASDGTKHASTRLWNHVGCAEPRSVTTVTKGVVRPVVRPTRSTGGRPSRFHAAAPSRATASTARAGVLAIAATRPSAVLVSSASSRSNNARRSSSSASRSLSTRSGIVWQSGCTDTTRSTGQRSSTASRNCW
mmetsp:Transcript_23859/g.94623  ORF Transcript_23859/g.94623 Transcript_23859/m.94623 type:complete len:298 (-) Transcript_23859:897-1790(-)